MSERLPLFPLRTVLVPGLVMPLSVFEPRYVALVEHLLTLPEDQRAFGVVALRHGRDAGSRHSAADLHAVGCSAVVRDITESDRKGGEPRSTYEVITSGAVRFRLDGVDEDAGTPYLTGLVSPVLERAGAQPDVLRDLAASVAEAWSAYRARLGIATSGVVGGLPQDPSVLSYLVVAGMVLDLPERQRLLEVPDTATRLREERSLLHREVALISELRSLPAQELTADEPNYN